MQSQHIANWNPGDPITSDRLNDINEEFSEIFKRISNEDLSLTYNISGQLETIVDNENSITINIDWSEWDNDPAKLFFHRVGDTLKYQILYDNDGYLDTITQIPA